MELHSKLKILRDNIIQMESIVVAGGVDSTFLLKVAHDEILVNVVLPYPVIDLDENAVLQSVINTIHARRQTSAPHLTFCGQCFLDTQDRSSHIPSLKKEILINLKLELNDLGKTRRR
jgi:hypothetical protein